VSRPAAEERAAAGPSTRSVLELRARLRHEIRRLFDERGFLEVDTPVLGREILPEAHIDPLVVPDAAGARYLQTSPEAFMKRLLAAGSGAIYQFAHAFRAAERGPQHAEEFMLLEWYEPGATLDTTSELLEAVCRATLGTCGLDRTTCGTAFRDHAGVDLLSATAGDFEKAAAGRGVVLPVHDGLDETTRRDRGFELVLAEVVQPRLGRDRPTMLEGWPVWQAAFARLDDADPRLARRFELFVAGVELANGWEEETSRDVLEARIGDANAVRAGDGRTVLPWPRRLVEAHGTAMPQGVGVALGFDRLVMLAAAAGSIRAIRCPADG
jgi:lysyl-tRNA synthetase class 2